jgi:RNA polymerase sigma factor (sigma-70 family)
MKARPRCDDTDVWPSVQGDPSALGTLFERHAQSVYDFCCWRTRDPHLAEDLTSAVFLEAWRRRTTVRNSGNCALPWLLGVANNLCRNAARSLRRHSAALKRMSSATTERPFDEAVVDAMAAGIAVERLSANWDELTDQEKEIVVLVFWSELSYQETADALGVPIGTIRSRVARARDKLQHSLAPVAHEGGNRNG